MAIIDEYQRLSKTNRGSAQKIRRKPVGDPDVRPATPEQVRNAREVKRLVMDG